MYLCYKTLCTQNETFLQQKCYLNCYMLDLYKKVIIPNCVNRYEISNEFIVEIMVLYFSEYENVWI